MVIERFSKRRPSAILDFENLQFLSCGFCRHAVLLPDAKFRWYRTISWWWVMAKKAIFNRISKISIFGHVTVIGFNIWCCVPNFIEIGRFFTEIWWYNNFKNGGHPPSWILKIFCFIMWPLSACGSASSHKISPKSDYRSMSYGQKKRFSRWRPPPSWTLKNFNFLSRDYSICSIYRISSKSDDFSLTYGDLTIFKMAAVGHLGF